MGLESVLADAVSDVDGIPEKLAVTNGFKYKLDPVTQFVEMDPQF